MKVRCASLVLLVLFSAPVAADPIVTLGPPVLDGFSTVDPGSIRIDMFGEGDVVDLQISMTFDPFCVVPIEVGLGTTGDGGTFANQTGTLLNLCNGDTSVFDIQLTGDGITRSFDIEFLNLGDGQPMATIPVELYPASFDTDSDGITDIVDNCTLISNPDQLDADDDGIGTRCDGDLDNDCFVGFEDLADFAALFGSANPVADFDGGGFVGFEDLAIFGELFGVAPGPSGLKDICDAR